MSNVQTEHPQYKERRFLRKRIRDCLSGTDRIKYRTTAYLPLPNMTCNNVNDDGYKSYLHRAYYINLPMRTVRGLAGLVMRKDPTMELNTSIDYLLDNADGAGKSLKQMIADGLDEVLSLGNFALASVMPLAADGITKANSEQFLPHLKLYREEQIINWRVTNNKLSMIVLLELEEKPDTQNMFKTLVCANYRVFYLNELGQVVEDYYKGKEADAIIQEFYGSDYYSGIVTVGGDWDVTSTTYAERTEIPVDFCGSIDNSAGLDPSPIENICDFALKMYMISADEMLNVHNASGGVLTMASALDIDRFKEFNGSTDIDVNFGVVHLGEGGSMSYVQAAASPMISETMDRLLSLAIAQGAQIIATNQQDKTATEARIDQGANLSQLGQIVRNASQVFTAAVNRCAMMINAADDADVCLNNEFFFEKITPQEMQVWMDGIMRGYLTQTDMQRAAKKGGWIDESRKDEDIEAELEEQRAESGTGVAAGFDAAGQPPQDEEVTQ